MAQTNKRVVQAVFANYKGVRENIAGEKREVALTAVRGQEVELTAEQEARLDALGALAPAGSTAEDVQAAVQARSDAVHAAIRRALNPTEAVAAVIAEQASVAAPGGGVAPVGDFVTGDTGGPDTPAPDASVTGPGDVPAGSPDSYDDLTVPELQDLADERGLQVEGTGADGNVLKGDLVAALEADDNK